MLIIKPQLHCNKTGSLLLKWRQWGNTITIIVARFASDDFRQFTKKKVYRKLIIFFPAEIEN